MKPERLYVIKTNYFGVMYKMRMNKNKTERKKNQILFVQFPILFADADFCCGMDTPEKAKNVSGWLPGRAQNRGAFQFPNLIKTKQQQNQKTINIT